MGYRKTFLKKAPLNLNKQQLEGQVARNRRQSEGTVDSCKDELQPWPDAAKLSGSSHQIYRAPYASRHARSNLWRGTVSAQEMNINDTLKHL